MVASARDGENLLPTVGHVRARHSQVDRKIGGVDLPAPQQVDSIDAVGVAQVDVDPFVVALGT